MPAADPIPPPGRVRTPPDKLSIVVMSGTYERVHYALVMASAALATNTPVTLFFTLGACRALERPGPDGQPGWHRLAGDARGGAATRDHALTARGVAGFETLLDACVALGATILVCEMGLRAEDMTRQSLRDDISIAVGGVVTFLADASREGALIVL